MTITTIHARFAALLAERNQLVKASDWSRFCDDMEAQLPALHDHLKTWGPSCGAPRSVYRGHLIRLLLELAETTTEEDAHA